MLFVAWELMSIPTYILVGFMKKNPASNEAALNTSCLVPCHLQSSFTESISYGLTGSTNIGESYPRLLQHLILLYYHLHYFQLVCLLQDLDSKWDLYLSTNGSQIPMKGLHQQLLTLLAAATKKAGFAATIRIVVLGMVVLNLDWTLVGILHNDNDNW